MKQNKHIVPITATILASLILVLIVGLPITLEAQVESNTSITQTQEEVNDQPNSENDTQTEEDDAIKKKILDLKERLATRVAEIQEQNKRAFFGVIKEKNDNKITLVDHENEQLVALDQDITVIKIAPKGTQTESNLDALELGEQVSVFGILDLDQKTLVADTAYIQELPKKLFGTVTEVDNNAGTFTVDGDSGVSVLDYEIGTRCSLFVENKRETCGLSKIEEGDFVYVRMIPEDDNLSQATAVRILLIPNENPQPTEEVLQEEAQ